ncbi:hypothetical protein V5O48_015103, partial [Marasmius crinis-equi]
TGDVELGVEVTGDYSEHDVGSGRDVGLGVAVAVAPDAVEESDSAGEDKDGSKHGAGSGSDFEDKGFKILSVHLAGEAALPDSDDDNDDDTLSLAWEASVRA